MPFVSARAASLSALVLVLGSGGAGCGAASPARPQAVNRLSAPAGLPALPGVAPSWAAGVAATGSSFASVLESMPCPVPGLPAELARLVDCGAMHKIAGAPRYVPASIVQAALPDHVELRATGLAGPIKNQEQVGACAGFALSTVMDNAARRMGRGDVVAPLHVFSTYGGGKGLASVRGVGMTLEPTWPYDPRRACEFADDWTGQDCGAYYGVPVGGASRDPVLLGEKAHADASARYRVDAFEEMDPVDPAQLALLVASGEAVWISMAFDQGAWSHGAVRDGTLQDFTPSFPVGHAVVVSGYRRGAHEREFLLHNSWGADWADHGSAWIAESTLKKRANYGYRLRVSDASLSGGNAMPGKLPSIPSWPGQTSSCEGKLATPFGCIDTGALPKGLPAGFPALPGFPAVQQQLSSCASGSFPDPFRGGCVHL